MISSALEHQVPEQMFTDPNSATKPEGFSTAKALGMAMAQGQKIYTINPQNQAQALQNLRLDSAAMEEIRSSLATGKEVITHTDQLSVDGFRGSGYAILDPITGEGVYKISGGKNGGYLDNYNSSGVSLGLFIAGLLVLAAGTAGIAAILAIILAAISVFHAVMTFMIVDLKIKESGCADGFSDLALGAEIAALVSGFFPQAVFVSAAVSFFVGGAVGAVCK